MLWHSEDLFAAYFALDNDNYAKVRQYVAMARNCVPSEFVEQSLRVLEIYADAKYMPLGLDYEVRLLDGVKYLTSWFEKDGVKEISESYLYYENIYNVSGLYPYDMLKKVLHGTVCPRYLKAYKVPAALALAYYADNLLAKHVATLGNADFDALLRGQRWRTYSFFLLDTEPIMWVEIFARGRLSCVYSPLYSYMNHKLMPDWDYLYDIIGTRFLREMDYGLALKYLSRVRPAYEQTLNTLPWLLKRNPLPWTQEDAAPCSRKLAFAMKMLALEKVMNSDALAGEVALAKIRYSLGIEASFNSCWAYTRYSDSSDEDFRWIGYVGNHGSAFNDANDEGLAKHSVRYPEYAKDFVARLRREAMASLPKDASRALAHYTWINSNQMQVHERLYDGCDDICSITEYYQTHCDGLSDYGSSSK